MIISIILYSYFRIIVPKEFLSFVSNFYIFNRIVPRIWRRKFKRTRKSWENKWNFISQTFRRRIEILPGKLRAQNRLYGRNGCRPRVSSISPTKSFAMRKFHHDGWMGSYVWIVFNWLLHLNGKRPAWPLWIRPAHFLFDSNGPNGQW